MPISLDSLCVPPYSPRIEFSCTFCCAFGIFTVEDELGETTTGTVNVSVIADIFSDTFESGNTDAWSG